jgi:CRP-like cAMP-binding protein
MIGNHFIDGLPREDREALLGSLSVVGLAAGAVLVEQGRRVQTVHFPLTASLANFTSTPTGRCVQTAVIGVEGLSGLAPFMADAPCAWQVVCKTSGNAYAGSADALRGLMDDRPGFRRRLLGLAHYYQAQANQSAVCNAYHPVEQRLARWILTVAETAGDSGVTATQQDIAADLGVQRTSVVAGFQRLKRDRLVRHVRGRIEILNWPDLRAGSCSCYGKLRTLAQDLDVGPITAAG